MCMVNPEVLKCHEDLITLETYMYNKENNDKKFFICENITIFGYLRARLGGGGMSINNQTGRILVHIYPLFNNNLHVNYRSNLTRTF